MSDSASVELDGRLGEHDFSDLVQGLHEGKESGILTLTNAGVGKSVTVQAGRLVFASSSSPDDRLGELLLRQDKISYRQYMDASAAIAPGRRLGTILLEQGALEKIDLVHAVVEHTQEIIYSLFRWHEGHYRFQRTTGTSEAITLRISTPDVILEGIRRIEAWSRIDRAIGGIGARYERAADYEELLPLMSLSFEKLSLLTGLNGVETVETICEESNLPDIDVCRTLWAYRVIGVVRCLEGPPQTPASGDDEGLGNVLMEG